MLKTVPAVEWGAVALPLEGNATVKTSGWGRQLLFSTHCTYRTVLKIWRPQDQRACCTTVLLTVHPTVPITTTWAVRKTVL